MPRNSNWPKPKREDWRPKGQREPYDEAFPPLVMHKPDPDQVHLAKRTNPRAFVAVTANAPEPIRKLAPKSTAKPKFTLVIFGPKPGTREKALDNPVFLDLLCLVQNRLSVGIDRRTLGPHGIAIYSDSRQTLRAAYKDIAAIAHDVESKRNKQMFVALVANSHKKFLSIDESGDDSSFGRLTLPRLAIDPAADQELLRNCAAGFKARLADMADVIRAVPVDITLQFHLGRMKVFAGHDGRKDDPASLLDKMIGGGGNPVVFDRRIGDGNVFNRLRAKIMSTSGLFFPLSPVAQTLSEVECTKYLVVVTSAFQIEMKIEPPVINNPGGRLSQPRVFQLVGTDGRSEVAAACPSFNLDWQLETLSELKADDMAPTIKDLLQWISIPWSNDDDTFPIPSVSASAIDAFRIQQVYGKTTWTVGCKGTSYIMDISRYYKFPRPGKSDEYSVATGVSISSLQWEDALSALPSKGVCRDMDANWSKVFQSRTGNDGITEFLALIKGVLTMTSSVLDSKDGAVESKRAESPQALPVRQPPQQPPPQQNSYKIPFKAPPPLVRTTAQKTTAPPVSRPSAALPAASPAVCKATDAPLTALNTPLPTTENSADGSKAAGPPNVPAQAAAELKHTYGNDDDLLSFD